MSNLVYVIEDDPFWQDWIIGLLAKNIPSVDVEIIATEKEFLARFKEIEERQPKCLIMDVMLQWTEASVDDSVAPGHFVEAGLRCYEKLVRNEATRDLQIIIYTVLDPPDVRGFPKDVRFLRKDASDAVFLKAVQSALAQ